MAKKGSNVNTLQQKNLIVSTYKEIFIFGALNRLDALNTLFKEITIPQAVLEELQKKLSPENVMILLHRINAQEKFRIIETDKNTEYFSKEYALTKAEAQAFSIAATSEQALLSINCEENTDNMAAAALLDVVFWNNILGWIFEKDLISKAEAQKCIKIVKSKNLAEDSMILTMLDLIYNAMPGR